MATKTVLVTSGTTWTVPADLDTSVNVTVRAFACGGAGRSIATSNTGTTGGGGGVCAESSVSLSGLTPGTSTCFIQVPTAPAANTATTTAHDVWFNKSANSAPASTTNGVLAKAGQLGAAEATGGVGGASGSCIGATVFSGGNGGARTTTGTSTG